MCYFRLKSESLFVTKMTMLVIFLGSFLEGHAMAALKGSGRGAITQSTDCFKMDPTLKQEILRDVAEKVKKSESFQATQRFKDLEEEFKEVLRARGGHENFYGDLPRLGTEVRIQEMKSAALIRLCEHQLHLTLSECSTLKLSELESSLTDSDPKHKALNDYHNQIRRLDYELKVRLDRLSKNRYSDNQSPVATRVRPKDGRYINANYMGPNQEFIGTQAPIKNTTDDFWHMVFESGSPLIVNLTTANETKSGKLNYWMWPENESVPTEYKVEVEGSEVTHDGNEMVMIKRNFLMTHIKTGKSRPVTQLHFLKWRNDGVPESKHLDTLLKAMHESHAGEDPHQPTVIHCSAGLGRTATAIGTFLIDKEKKKSKVVSEDLIDVMVTELRKQRGEGAVRTDQQLKMMYDLGNPERKH